MSSVEYVQYQEDIFFLSVLKKKVMDDLKDKLFQSLCSLFQIES